VKHVICTSRATSVDHAISPGPARHASCVISANGVDGVDGVGYVISGTMVYMREVHAVS
jgi:hypothetical protein